MKTTFWLLSLLGSLAAGVIIFLTMTMAKGAPQEAAGYAMACAFAVVPYVLARSIAAMSDNETLVEICRSLQAIERQGKKPESD